MALYAAVRHHVLYALWVLLAIPSAVARADTVNVGVAPASAHPSSGDATQRVPEDPPLIDRGDVDDTPLPSTEVLLDTPAVMRWLRSLEADLSGGVVLDEESTANLVAVVRRHPQASVRAAATGVLAWLPPSTSAVALISAARDDVDARVRAQALAGIAPSSSRAPDPIRHALLEAISAALRDPAAEVFCAAAEALATADPAAAGRVLPSLADDTDRGRYECLRRLVPLPERPLYTPAAEQPQPAVEVAETALPRRAAPLLEDKWSAIEPTFVAVATGFGVVAGGLLPGLFLPPRDTLLYRGDHSVRSREEVSMWLAGATAAVGGAALGGAAGAVQGMSGPVPEGEGTALLLGTAAGAMALGGAGLAAGLDGNVQSALWLSGGGTALLGGAALSLSAPPARDQTGAALAIGSQAALFTGLLGVAAFPRGDAGPTEDLSQLQRPLGVASMAGGGATLLALALARWYPLSPRRVGFASAAATAAATGATALGWLCLPLDQATRERAAAAVGASAQFVAAGAALLWLPDEDSP